MPPSILIITSNADMHTYAVAEALRHKGVEPTLWESADFPVQGTETVSYLGGDESLKIHGVLGELANLHPTTVWRRRPAISNPEPMVDPADGPFARGECRDLRDGLMHVLAPDAFWVNRPSAAENKILQHHHARRIGLRTPDTLFSNDPQEIRRFLAEHPSGVIYKGFRPGEWLGDDRAWLLYTQRITADDLVCDELLRAAPGIYQALVPKRCELRVTVMGNRAFAARIDSQVTAKGQLDWRRAYDEIQLDAHELEPELVAKCTALLRRLGIVFGCFDFVITPEGEAVFLEVNPMGQFLWVEDMSGLPLLDAFCELLIQGTPDFEWSEDRVEVRWTDVVGPAEVRAREAANVHPSTRVGYRD